MFNSEKNLLPIADTHNTICRGTKFSLLTLCCAGNCFVFLFLVLYAPNEKKVQTKKIIKYFLSLLQAMFLCSG